MGPILYTRPLTQEGKHVSLLCTGYVQYVQDVSDVVSRVWNIKQLIVILWSHLLRASVGVTFQSTGGFEIQSKEPGMLQSALIWIMLQVLVQ